MSTETKPNDTPLHGVSLARYAAVNAAVAEGFPLEQVLEIEQVDAYSFERADVKWKKRLADAVGTAGGLVQRYQAELAAAEDWLTRPVTPIDGDLASWMIFLNAYSAAPDPAALLARHGLGLNDLSRLSRLWKQRIEDDPSLAERITSLPTHGDVPPVQVEPPVLKRSRQGGAAAAEKERPRAPAKSAGAAPLDVEAFGLERYAQVRAERLASLTTAADRAASNVSEGSAPVLPTFLARQRGAQRPEIGKDYLSAPEAAGPPPPASPPPPAPPPLPVVAPKPAGTMNVGEIVRQVKPLPFGQAPDPTPSAALARAVAHADAAQGPAPEKAQSGGTLNVDSVEALGPALPFAEKAGAPAPKPAAAEPEAEARPPALELKRYVSLTVELSADPARRAETLSRYRLTEAGKTALDKVYKARFAADPAARAEFENAMLTYRAWLASQSRK